MRERIYVIYLLVKCLYVCPAAARPRSNKTTTPISSSSERPDSSLRSKAPRYFRWRRRPSQLLAVDLHNPRGRSCGWISPACGGGWVSPGLERLRMMHRHSLALVRCGKVPGWLCDAGPLSEGGSLGIFISAAGFARIQLAW